MFAVQNHRSPSPQNLLAGIVIPPDYFPACFWQVHKYFKPARLHDSILMEQEIFYEETA
jgi:hypothetical protein